MLANQVVSEVALAVLEGRQRAQNGVDGVEAELLRLDERRYGADDSCTLEAVTSTRTQINSQRTMSET